jgi:hypothetical protein
VFERGAVRAVPLVVLSRGFVAWFYRVVLSYRQHVESGNGFVLAESKRAEGFASTEDKQSYEFASSKLVSRPIRWAPGVRAALWSPSATGDGLCQGDENAMLRD